MRRLGSGVADRLWGRVSRLGLRRLINRLWLRLWLVVVVSRGCLLTAEVDVLVGVVPLLVME